MKYDLSKKPTAGSRRTLDAFSGTLFKLLRENSFENIATSEICRCSGYPRATFYNYFDDKYDLLNFCWHRIGELIHLEQGASMSPEEGVHVFFDRVSALCVVHETAIKQVLAHNDETGFLLNRLRSVVGANICAMMQDCPYREGSRIPCEILAAHYANTLLLVLECRFVREPACTDARAHEYLRDLLAGV